MGFKVTKRSTSLKSKFSEWFKVSSRCNTKKPKHLHGYQSESTKPELCRHRLLNKGTE